MQQQQWRDGNSSQCGAAGAGNTSMKHSGAVGTKLVLCDTEVLKVIHRSSRVWGREHIWSRPCLGPPVVAPSPPHPTRPHTSHVTRHISHVTSPSLTRHTPQPHTSHITHHTSHITRHTSHHPASHFTCHSSHVTHHISHLTCHTSHVTHHTPQPHTSHVTHHTSHITCHTSHVTHSSLTRSINDML